MHRLFTLIILSLFLTHCLMAQIEHSEPPKNDANEYMLRNSHEDLARAFDSSERDQWQKPDEVIAFLGEIEEKTIVDLGSGSGYFTFRLLAAGANVIAADVDDEFLSIIKDKVQKLGLEDENLNTLLLDDDRLNVTSRSVDILFLVNVYHHISDRVNYFRQANSVLKEDGKIVIVDFYKKKLPVGPPKDHKISKDLVLDELTSAGYEEVAVDEELLDYQYIIVANQY